MRHRQWAYSFLDIRESFVIHNRINLNTPDIVVQDTFQTAGYRAFIQFEKIFNHWKQKRTISKPRLQHTIRNIELNISKYFPSEQLRRKELPLLTFIGAPVLGLTHLIFNDR